MFTCCREFACSPPVYNCGSILLPDLGRRSGFKDTSGDLGDTWVLHSPFVDGLCNALPVPENSSHSL